MQTGDAIVIKQSDVSHSAPPYLMAAADIWLALIREYAFIFQVRFNFWANRSLNRRCGRMVKLDFKACNAFRSLATNTVERLDSESMWGEWITVRSVCSLICVTYARRKLVTADALAREIEDAAGM